MLKIYTAIGFLLFFIGMFVGVSWSKEWGLKISVFGFMIASLSIGFITWLGKEKQYIAYRKIFSIIWVGTIIYHTSEVLGSPYLISPWFVYSAYFITCVTFLYLVMFNNQNTIY